MASTARRTSASEAAAARPEGTQRRRRGPISSRSLLSCSSSVSDAVPLSPLEFERPASDDADERRDDTDDADDGGGGERVRTSSPPRRVSNETSDHERRRPRELGPCEAAAALAGPDVGSFAVNSASRAKRTRLSDDGRRVKLEFGDSQSSADAPPDAAFVGGDDDRDHIRART